MSITLQQLHSSALALHKRFIASPRARLRKLNRVERIQNIPRVCLLCTFFSLALSMHEHGSEVQLFLLTSFARQLHIVVPMLFTKPNEHHFFWHSKRLQCHYFGLRTWALKSGGLVFQNSRASCTLFQTHWRGSPFLHLGLTWEMMAALYCSYKNFHLWG